MKISQTGAGSPTSRRRGISGATDPDAADSFKGHMKSGEAPTSNSVASSTPLTALTTLLSIQETPDAAEERRQGLLRGNDLLDELTVLQRGLIDGTLSEATLRRVAHILDGPRPVIDDPELKHVLDEIEVRAAVELAKLEREADEGRGERLPSS